MLPWIIDLFWFLFKMVGVLYFIILVYFGSFARCASAKECPEICRCLGDYVDCSHKKLQSLPSSIPKWVSHLNLNNNQIRKLTDNTWHNLSRLTELRLNKNNISTVPKDFFDNLKRLKRVDMNQNQLKDIDALTFKELGQLGSLQLKRNHISQLKDGAFFGLGKIKILNLDYNNIRIISKGWLYGLDSLRELSLNNNNINQIETDAWEFCLELVQLDLSFNHMSTIKADTFKYLKELQKLNLNNNNISYIEDNAFIHLPKLKVLEFNSNKISWTIEDANGVFRGLNGLKYFHLTWNNIKSISKNAFIGLHNLEELDLSGNNITSVQKNPFTEMPYLKDLSLNTTSLLCDCNIRWFAEWLNEKKIDVDAICSYPSWLNGETFLKVPMSNFTWDELPKPRLIGQPATDIMALKGENINLSCKAVSSSASGMVFQWKKDNVQLVNADISVTTSMLNDNDVQSLSELKIYKVQHTDEGKYQCVVSNEYGTVYSPKSNILVLTYPVFDKTPQNITVRAGATAKLECAAHGEPQPEIAWHKDGGNDFPAARERRMHVMPTDDVFFIINTTPSDMGIYSCTAKNAAGIIVANASLSIEELPSFIKPMEDKEITAGESVVLPCMASGTPKPTIEWLKDGEPIHTTERHFFTAEDQLMIIVDTLPSDAGTYQCQLNNSLGKEIGFSRLQVKSVDVMNTSNMWGIIIITVVCCAVVTSIVWVVIIYHTRRKIATTNTTSALPESHPPDFTERSLQYIDTASENSCKDSGTGDSAKRSNDNLAPEEYTLIINENNSQEKAATSMRAASLLYMVTEGNNSHAPLLHSDTPPNSTNHDRLHELGDLKLSEDIVCSSSGDLSH